MSAHSIFKQWIDLRGVLNHDVLCNQLRNELLSLQEEPKGHEAIRLKTWVTREDEYRGFLTATVDALSPNGLISCAGLACWTEEQIRVYANVAHALFLAETDMTAIVKRLTELLAAAVCSAKRLLSTPRPERSNDMVADLSVLVDKLSEGISDLPRSIGG